MKQMKKAILCMMLVLTMSMTFVGCGRHVPTTKEVEEAYEEMQAGDMNPNEYYELWDAWNNGEKVGTPIIVTIGEIVLVVVVAVGVFKFLKNKKGKTDDKEKTEE